jgi:hypothetical protein
MKWQDVREIYPNRWLLIEAIEAHTTPEKRRIVDHLAVIDHFADFFVAMDRYKQFHHQKPEREMYVIHTNNEEIYIHEQYWAGIRSGA